MQIFHICESRVLTAPLSNGASKYICFKIANEEEQIWFVQWFNLQGLPVYLRAFVDMKEFERYYKTIKKSFRNENKQEQEQQIFAVAGFRQGENVPF